MTPSNQPQRRRRCGHPLGIHRFTGRREDGLASQTRRPGSPSARTTPRTDSAPSSAGSTTPSTSTLAAAAPSARLATTASSTARLAATASTAGVASSSSAAGPTDHSLGRALPRLRHWIGPLLAFLPGVRSAKLGLLMRLQWATNVPFSKSTVSSSHTLGARITPGTWIPTAAEPPKVVLSPIEK